MAKANTENKATEAKVTDETKFGERIDALEEQVARLTDMIEQTSEALAETDKRAATLQEEMDKLEGTVGSYAKQVGTIDRKVKKGVSGQVKDPNTQFGNIDDLNT